MKRLLSFLIIVSAVSISAAPFNVDPQSSVPVLVPMAPSQSIDGYGARWSVALIGYNSAAADVVVPCDQAQCPRFRAGEAFNMSGVLGASGEPMVLRIPGDRIADLQLEEQVRTMNPSMAVNPSRSLRIPVVRLDSITQNSITFLNIDSDQIDTRTSIRVYSALWGPDSRSVTMTIYREYEGRSSPLYSREFKMNEVVTNGIRIGYIGLSWPAAVARTPFPTRVTIESDGPIWGFVTTSERSNEPAVSLTLPSAK